MRPLSKDLREFIHLLNREAVEYLIVGAWAVGFHARPRYTGDVDVFVRRKDWGDVGLLERTQPKPPP
jgi:hypothetical protein